MTTYAPMTFRGRNVNPRPPAVGIRGRIVLKFLRHREQWEAWPPSRLIEECALDEVAGYAAIHRLLELGLLERHSSDTFTRVRITKRGRRFRA